MCLIVLAVSPKFTITRKVYLSFNLCKPPQKSVSLKNRYHGVISGSCPNIYVHQSSGFVCVQFEANWPAHQKIRRLSVTFLGITEPSPILGKLGKLWTFIAAAFGVKGRHFIAFLECLWLQSSGRWVLKPHVAFCKCTNSEMNELLVWKESYVLSLFHCYHF